MQEYLQAFITVISSAAIALILRQQIKSQQEQINSMQSSMSAMKAYMDIFKIDELKKYVAVIEERAVARGQLTAEKTFRELLNSEEWHEKFMKPIEIKMEEQMTRILEQDLYQRYDELLNMIVEQLVPWGGPVWPDTLLLRV